MRPYICFDFCQFIGVMTMHIQVALMCLSSSAFLITSANQMLQKLPLGCIDNWTPTAALPRLPLTRASSLCVYQSKSNECLGIRCPSNICEAMSEFNFTRHCLASWQPRNAGLFLSNISITDVSQEIHMVSATQGELKSIQRDNSSSIPMPHSKGRRLLVQLEDGILSCVEYTTSCYYWTLGSRDWLPFSRLQERHIKGVIHLLDGRPIILGGTPSGSGSFDKVEIHNGIKWVDGPPLLIDRASFGSASIDGLALVVVGGFNEGVKGAINKVEILHADTMVWKPLPDYPLTVRSFACGHVKFEERHHMLCSGGNPHSQFQTYALDLTRSDSVWQRKAYLDAPTRLAKGFLFQWKNILFYLIMAGTSKSPFSRVYRLDLEESDPVWVNMELYSTDDAFLSTTVVFVTRYVFIHL